MIYELTYIASLATINRLRGSDLPLTSKGLTSLLCGLSTGLLAYILGYEIKSVAIISLISFVGIWLWAMFRWGNGFASFTGRYTPRKYGIVEKIVAKFAGNKSGFVKGWLYMTIRGLYLLPLFIALSIFLQNYFVAIIGFAGGLQGCIYSLARIVPEKYGVAFSEILTGGLIGLMLVISLIIK